MNVRFDEDYSNADVPEIIIDSIYPVDKERLLKFGFVSKELSYCTPNEKSFLKKLNNLGIKDAVTPSGEIIQASEMAKRLSNAAMKEIKNKPWERFANENDLAERTTLKTMREIYGYEVKGLTVKGWIPGARVWHENGDYFELTGNKCQRCHVNPEAYGHGGGIRCYDVDNCGYWFCY